MEYLFIILALGFAIVGLLGAVVPVLPGPPVGFVALLMLLMCDGHDVTNTQLILSGVFAVVITIVDYIAPVFFAKKTGATKAGTWGATIGLLLGFFLGPIGVIAGPFVGALVGELITKATFRKAFRVAVMTFLAFMLTTGMKLIYGVVIFSMVCSKGWNIISN